MEVQAERFIENELIIYSLKLRVAPFKKGDVLPEVVKIDYDSLLKESLEEGFISSEEEIKCLVYGIEFKYPYLSSLTKDEEYNIILKNQFIP